jgi:recombination DNA repair RAD52 pathway protein
MPFSPEQISELNAPLSRSAVKQREQAGRKFSYVEGWHVIAEANRIFGFDRWTSKTVETCCVVERERLIGKQALPGWGVTYTAKVSIVVDTNDDHWITRDGCGTGHGIDTDLGLAHESAIKEAETDARKRALMTFGNPFGLALYDKEQAHVVDESELSRQRYVEQCKTTIEALAADPDKLMAWWNGEKQSRRDFDLTPAEVILLKGLVTAKLPVRTAT